MLTGDLCLPSLVSVSDATPATLTASRSVWYLLYTYLVTSFRILTWSLPCYNLTTTTQSIHTVLLYHVIRSRINFHYQKGQKVSLRHLTRQDYTNKVCESNRFPSHLAYSCSALSIFQNRFWIHHNSWILKLDKVLQIINECIKIYPGPHLLH